MEWGRYISIPPDTRSIRILTLEPGNSDDEIRCRLDIAHFDDDLEEYEVVSYVWGDQSCTKLIECSGTQVPGDNISRDRSSNISLSF